MFSECCVILDSYLTTCTANTTMYFHCIFLTATGFMPGNLQNLVLDVIRISTAVNRNCVLEFIILKVTNHLLF